MTNQITFIGMKSTKALCRFVEHQMERWILREKIRLLSPVNTSFHITIEREEDPHYFFVQIEVCIGSQTWESHEGGKTLQDAFFQSLRHLKPKLTKTLCPSSTLQNVEIVA